MKFSKNKVDSKNEPSLDFISTSGNSSPGKRCVPSCKLLVIIALVLLILFIVILAIVLALVLRRAAPVEPKNDDNLGADIMPLHYVMTLFPDMYAADDVFLSGEATITVKVRRTTPLIRLNILRLNITGVKLVNLNTTRSIRILDMYANITTDTWVIEASKNMPLGSLVNISLTYNGTLDHPMIGFYKGYFNVPGDSRTRYLAATKFEPASARLAFPCFDDPRLKALYTVSLVHKRSHVALSNTRQVAQENATFEHRDGDGLVISRFETTPHIMSTYLVAMVVMESYGHLRGDMADGRVMRYFAPQHRLAELSYAAEVGRQIRAHLDGILRMRSPLQKVDMISIPQFVSGAMENWGLIMYRERLLLLKPDDLDIEKYHICRVIAHELVHTWFGNIVTMNWWNELWLNEAFATHFAAVATEATAPQWNATAYSVLTNRRNVMRKEMEPTGVPIIQEIHQRSQMRSMFNTFVYSKGAALLHWLTRIIGKEKFMTGIQNYLEANKFATGTGEKLFQHWDKTGLPHSTRDIMTPWLYNRGFPVIYIDYNATTGSLTVRQKSIYSLVKSPDPKTPPSNGTWWVEVKMRFKEAPAVDRKVLLTTSQDEVSIKPQNEFGTDFWVVLNSDSFGYYRSRYDSKLLARLVSAFETNPRQFDELQRALFIDDAFVLGYLGEYNMTQSLATTSYLHKEITYSPWYTFHSNLRRIERMIPVIMLEPYMRNKTSHLFTHWNNSDSGLSFPRNLKRELFFYLACQYSIWGDPCLRQTGELFQKWLATTETLFLLPKEVRKYVLHFGMKQNNTEENWSRLFSLYTNESASEESKQEILYGLIVGPTTARFDVLVPKVVKKQDGSIASSDDLQFGLGVLLANEQSTLRLWEWTKRECVVGWSDVTAAFCRPFLKTVLIPVTKYFYTATRITDVAQVFTRLPDEFAYLQDYPITPNIMWNQDFEKVNMPDVINFLRNYSL